MEREKNVRLTTEEKLEEEKMKQELTDIGIYEEGITYGQMKQIIGFIKESKDTSNAGSNIKNIQKGTQNSNNECLLETNKSDTNTAQEDSQDFGELPRPSYSYRTSTTLERKNVRHSNSPESSSFEIQNSTYRRKSSDDDGTSEKQQQQQHESTNSTHSTNRFFSSRSGSTLRDCQNTAGRSADIQGEVIQKLERWQLNPLDVFDNENDVPLRQPNRPVARERPPFGYCKHATLEDYEQIGQALGQHLKEMADLQYSWRPSSGNSVFQWGSPIQVGTADDSSDRTAPLTDTKTEQIKAEQYVYRDSYERVSKRKANDLIRGCVERNGELDDEENKQHGSARVKKKKQSASGKPSNANRNANHQQAEKLTLSNAIAHPAIDDNSETDTSFDHKRSFGSKRKLYEQNERVSPELVMYPKRIVPPNPRKRLSLSRLRKGSAATKPSQKTQSVDKVIEQAKSQGKSVSLTTEEIHQKLVDDWPSDKEDDTNEKNVIIQPLSLSREIQEKLLSSYTSTTTKNTKAAANDEDSDWEQSREKRLRLDEEQKQQELGDKIDKNGNGSWEHQLMLSDDDDDDDMFEVKRVPRKGSDVQNGNRIAHDDVSTSTSDDKVNCPICNQLFPRKDIEDHAASCYQFELNSDETGAKSLLECTVCNKYKTNDGTEYQEHVANCIEKKKRLHESEETASTSFRTFKSISELKDSEIDYLNQLSPESKQTNSNRKKKC